jgi:glycosyltransferase involved in cell wall biosynthesis
MKIALVVHGRFHAFDLARELIERGHDVTLFTNYPKSITTRFGLAPDHVRSCPLHGALSFLVYRLRLNGEQFQTEPLLHDWFGRWSCAQLKRQKWDVVYSWSGISEPLLRQIPPERTLRLLVRGSSHIQSQTDLLVDEMRRTGVPQERPSRWRIKRELREYQLADAVIVLSSFCRQTFLEQGFPPERVQLMISGTRVETFRPAPEVVESRCQRILVNAPLQVLTVGTFCYRKGIHDLAETVRSVDPTRFRFRFVGAIHPEAAELYRAMSDRIEFVDRLPQSELPAQYHAADLFLFPTIEDGFPAVMAQAAAAGLPTLTTPNGAGLDLVVEGRTGWIVPVRSPEALTERLRWCDVHRSELAEMARSVYAQFRPRDWSVVAGDFEMICQELRPRKSRRRVSSNAVQDVGRIAFVVHGRFYSFDLARELIRMGVDVTVFTNYPKRVAARFGLAPESVRSFVLHGVASRFVQWLGFERWTEPALHRWFGCWARRAIQGRDFAIVQSFSGVAEEVLDALNGATIRALVRGSTHIRTQAQLLEEEERRAGTALDRPTPWRIAREEREYAKADVIFVLSEFARRSFLEHGINADKLRLLPLGSSVARFRPRAETIEQRSCRILSGTPLRILNVGSFSFRKGALDIAQIAQTMHPRCQFRVVGDLPFETRRLRSSLRGKLEFIRRAPEEDLPAVYAWADLFLFPTIEDGYAVVLAHARAAGLPILATSHCAAPELIEEGRTGWILPVRSADAFCDRLRWCDANRKELCSMIHACAKVAETRDWSDVASEFVQQMRASRGLQAIRSQREYANA